MGAVFLVPTAAMATPPVGVTGTIIYQKTIGDTDYILGKSRFSLVARPDGTRMKAGSTG
jgi:hypothetical protein